MTCWLKSSYLRQCLSSLATNSPPPKQSLPFASIPIKDLNQRQIIQRLSPTVVSKLKPTLKLHQWKNALRIHESKLPFPSHMLNRDPLQWWPTRGCHPALSVPLRKKGGRNHHGKITCRHRGGGFKRRIRLVDMQRTNQGKFKVIRMEHDPNRSAKIALVQSEQTKQVSYVLAWEGLKEGDAFENVNPEREMTGAGPRQLPGNSCILRSLALGTTIHNIELQPGQGGQICRSAGTKATLVAKDESRSLATIKLPSGKLKKVPLDCRATIGVVGNAEWHLRILGKAGRRRNLGWRPTVRGVAMNAVDHPHGGGKGGRSKGHHSQSPWGKICK